MLKLNKLSVDAKLDAIHIIKIMVAVLIGYFIVHINPEPHATWIILSIIIIMMSHASVSVQMEKAFSRAFGTCIGAALGILVLLMHNGLITNAIILMFVTASFCYIRIKKFISDYATILGLATFVMVIVAHNADWTYGVARAGEIILGITISLLVSNLIYPISSNKMLNLYLDKNWHQLLKYTKKALLEDVSRNEDASIREMEYKILQRHSNIEKILRIKPFTKRQQTHPELTLLARYQLGIYRYVTHINIALHSQINHEPCISPELKDSFRRCCNTLIEILSKINNIDIEKLNGLSTCINGIKDLSNPQTSSAIPADTAIIFSMQRIIVLLEKIQEIYKHYYNNKI